MPQTPVTAVGFDVGDTLVEYEGLPLSWVAYYGAALRELANHLGITATDAQLARGADVLRRYNTRLNPRDHEVPFRRILDEIASEFGVPAPADELPAARPFFDVFRQRLRAFPDAWPMLDRLRQRGVQVGCFTDVPYGMPREFVLEDIERAKLSDVIDVVITSREAGFRKPAAATLARIAAELGATRETFLYVGNEEKDIIAANAFGCRSVLLDRTGAAPMWGQSATIRSLSELERLLSAPL